jgi:acid phosphatase family membrane protein YuiD
VLDLLRNRVLFVALAGWFVAQALKVVLELTRHRRLDAARLTGAGGMPSSHSALVTALAAAVARDPAYGLSSPLFAIAAIFAGVVMYDAAGVRQAVSIQARLLNRMMDDFFAHRGLDQKRLRELIGHTPRQVIAGAFLGIAIGVLLG